MEAATIMTTNSDDMVVESTEKNFEFDIKVEQRFLTVHARLHILYTFFAILFVSILSLGVYFLS